MTREQLTPITDQSALAEACERLAEGSFLCVDTEFHRETTYWPELCLIQASCEGYEVIIDPMAEDLDIGPFLQLLADESRPKVFHAARQDIEIFNRLLGHPPRPVFDTQIAAMALGIGDSISYDNLIQRLLKRRIDKSSQFTDWKRRPLTEKQLVYAMGDVTHLRDAYLKIMDRLSQMDRMHWAQAEMEELADPALYDTSPENAWKRLKMRKPNKEYAAIFASVAAWREEKAQTINKPRRRILKDDAIQEIAGQKPQNEKAFERLRAVPKGFIRSKYAEGLMDAVYAAVSNPDAHAPELPKRQHNPEMPAGAPEMLKVLLKAVSDEANVVPRLIANASDVEKLARGETSDDIAALSGWRYELFGKKALALLSGKLALSFENDQVRLFEL
ncbi:MAG: ribonuclease D [Hyphomonadaceae bacterium]|nr:ribonuclease D [Hyphomonadaceae bacterium]